MPISARIDRAYRGVRGIQSLTPKTGQQWKYKGGSVERAPSVNLGSGSYTDHKHPGERLPRRYQESNFFVTINTNKAPDGEVETATAVHHCEQMLSHLSGTATLNRILRFGPRDQHYARDRFEDVIADVDWQSNVEIGDQQGRVHAHIWVTVKHYSQVQIDIPKLTQEARVAFNAGLSLGSKLRVINPYVNVKLLPQSDFADIMRGYMAKAALEGGSAET